MIFRDDILMTLRIRYFPTKFVSAQNVLRMFRCYTLDKFKQFWIRGHLRHAWQGRGVWEGAQIRNKASVTCFGRGQNEHDARSGRRRTSETRSHSSHHLPDFDISTPTPPLFQRSRTRVDDSRSTQHPHDARCAVSCFVLIVSCFVLIAKTLPFQY